MRCSSYRCLFVFGFQTATAVSLNGLKKIEPSFGDCAKPMPCDDFLPTSRIGSSAPNGSGPARNALVFTENSLHIMRAKNGEKNVDYAPLAKKLFGHLPVGGQWLEVNDANGWIERDANNAVH